MASYSGTRSGISSRFPVYHLDFTAQACGKRVASTKRRVRWRFGFTNQEALDAGKTGMACRGEEHDVTLVWSITSGKRQIMMDGQEISYASSRAGLIDFSWPMKGNHMLKVTAHAAPPMSATPGFRQYDLHIDGQSFFDLPKVYELGIRGAPQAHSRIPGDVGGYAASRGGNLQAQEEADIQRAIEESLAESRRHLGTARSQDSGGGAPAPPPVPAPAPNLLDFAAPVAAAPPVMPAAPQSVPPPAAYPAAVAPAIMPAGGPPPPAASYAAPPPPAAAPYAAPPPAAPVVPGAGPGALVAYQPPAQPPVPFASPSTVPPQPSMTSPDAASMASAPQTTQFAPAPPQPTFAPPPAAFPAAAPVAADPFAKYDDPFAPRAPPPPTKSDIHSAILGAYSGTPATPQANGVPPQPNFSTPQVNGTPTQAPPTDAAVVGGLSMNAPLAISEDANGGVPKSELEKAMNNLVNFDDISAPAEKEMKLTMAKEEAKVDPKKSKPLPPVATKMVGTAATLDQIKTVKPTMTPKDPETIMKPAAHLYHPDAVNAGALIVHGEGPPPLEPRGFGVGYGPHPGYR